MSKTLHKLDVPPPPTESQLSNLIKFSKGWQSQTQEFEFWFEQVDVEGTIPAALQGTFFRNGPGLTDVYGHPLKHPIDGDGMICALTFIQGKAHFRSRYVKTKSHVDEENAKKMLYYGRMGSKPPASSSAPKFRDPSHTNVFYWGNKLLTCHEYSLPHCLDPNTLSTLGKDDLRGILKNGTMSAHFRYDNQLDRLVVVSFRPGVMGTPIISFYEFDHQWNLLHELTKNIDGLNYVHDFLLTPDYYVVHMTPFVSVSDDSIQKVYSGQVMPGELMQYYPELPSRFVFISRFGGEVHQVETEPCHIFHFGTCQQNGNRVEFNAVCLPPGFNMEFKYKLWLSNATDAPGAFWGFTVDLQDKTCERSQLDACSCEFPTVHPFRHIPTHSSPRYVYLMGAALGERLPYTEVVKVDLQQGKRITWRCNGGGVGEPIFIPRLGFASAEHGAEDDGWVIVQCNFPDNMQTEYVILDAKTLNLVCKLKTRRHIPYAFHGTWWPEVFIRPQPKL